jgi:hypothetical protein
LLTPFHDPGLFEFARVRIEPFHLERACRTGEIQNNIPAFRKVNKVRCALICQTVRRGSKRRFREHVDQVHPLCKTECIAHIPAQGFHPDRIK